MLKQLRRQRGKSGKEMIVRDKTGSSDCSNHRIDATETQRVPHLGGEIGVEYQGKLFFFFFFFNKRLHRNLFKSPVYTVQILRRHVSLVGD